MRSRHESYEQYLLTVLGNPNFITLDRGAQESRANRQYKGIDFIVARKTESSLSIYYVRCTVRLPQHHDIVESELYGGWEQLLVNAAALGVYRSQLVFLTPNSPEQAKGLTLPRIFASFFKSKALHIQFGDIKGDHQLVRAIKDRF
ncbi:expressed unknown protein [Seminavis robusta]|uniref:Uncharacterized protein n=1 Tax=Seminavis robusta TaxID=568900 RepID=A0A9N8DRG5_9STRA|nr:expressed unknown protein [Seminavis robusta]|eukprot:Sro318_g115930.1 n/a (146) ;mRNA; r:37670-38311